MSSSWILGRSLRWSTEASDTMRSASPSWSAGKDRCSPRSPSSRKPSISSGPPGTVSRFATLIVLAEELGTNQIFTLDKRGFSTYRGRGRAPFVIYPWRPRSTRGRLGQRGETFEAGYFLKAAVECDDLPGGRTSGPDERG